MRGEVQWILQALQEKRNEEARRVQGVRAKLLQGDPALQQLARAARGAAADSPQAQAYRTALQQACQQAGFPAEALQLPPPQCPLCQDTGVVAGQLCSCVRNRAAQLQYRADTAEATFATFDETRFSPTQTVRADGTSLRTYMGKLKGVLAQFCERYPQTQYQCITLSGAAGVGKTFLLKCMAHALRSRGFTVVFTTAYRLNETLHQSQYGRADVLPLLDCDVLCIDDLGSEPMYENSTLRGLFNLLNDRWENGRAVLISTNLSTENIRSRYEERIYSRLCDSRYARTYTVPGEDLRRKR